MSGLRRFVVGVPAAVLGLAFSALMVSCLVALAIWPGQIKLVSFLFCSDAQPDAFVVADSYNVRPGETVVNFSLYCMGPRGDATDQGFFFPFVAVTILNALIIVLLVVLLVVWRFFRPDGRSASKMAPTDAVGSDRLTADERLRRTSPPPGSTQGPFVG